MTNSAIFKTTLFECELNKNLNFITLFFQNKQRSPSTENALEFCFAVDFISLARQMLTYLVHLGVKILLKFRCLLNRRLSLNGTYMQSFPAITLKHVRLFAHSIKQTLPTLYVKLLKATARERKFMSNSLCSNNINYIIFQ